MFKKLAKTITESQVELGQVDADGKDINHYGLEIGFAFLANCILTLIIGFMLGMLTGAIIYSIAFFTLRRYTGGFHLPSHLGCMILSATSTMIALYLAKRISEAYFIPIFLVFTFIGGALILLFAPVESVNKPLDAMEVVVYRKYAAMVLILLITSIVFLAVIQLSLYAVIITFVIFQVGLSVLLGRFVTLA